MSVRQQKLDSLLVQVEQCQQCTNLALGPRPILQCHTRARILIAGQAPGRVTHEAGIPFDDISGKRLRGWLGVDRDQFYNAKQFAILPMGFCYPGKGAGGDLPPRERCAIAWRQRLLAYMSDIELTLLIGRYSIDWHRPELASEKLSDIVADWQALAPAVFVLPHPSPRNQAWLKRNPLVEKSILPALRKRVREVLKG